MFKPGAVREVTLVKGGVPARYGGRASSLLDVRMSEGNYKKLKVNGGVGLIFSRLSIEGPIKRDTSSFLVAARRSYIDLLAGPFRSEEHTSELQSLMRISYAVYCLKKKII